MSNKEKDYMKVFTLFSIVLLACFISCDLEPGEPFDSNADECIEHYLTEFEMKAYNGEELDCKSHAFLYRYNDVYFSFLQNHCIDRAPFFIYDCEGREYCFTSVGPCHIIDGENLGIFGIEK